MELLHLLKLRLRFTRETQMHFFHHPALYAALMDRLDTPEVFPPGVAIHTPERGRVHYRQDEPYHLGAALLPGGDISPRRFARLIASPPTSDYGKTYKAPFGDNYTLESATDLVSDNPLFESPPRPLTLDMATKAADALAAEKDVTLRFLSPLLILRSPVASKKYLMDGEVFLPLKFLERVAQSVSEWWPDAPFAKLLHSPTNGTAALTDNRLIRTDVAYPKKRLLGASGSVTLRFEDSVGEWALPLLLAGIVGIGKGRNMGQGRFEIIGHSLSRNWPPKPVRTIMERAANADNIALARQALTKAGPAPGVDDVGKEDFLDSLTFEIPRLTSALRKCKLEPQPLRGLIVRERNPETGGIKLRPLAIPTLRDRFLQRAVLQELEPAIEQLLEDSSFAYRRGLSHRKAKHSVEQAHEQGYEYVLDADIRSFFDEVDWEKLRTRLEAYFGDDPVVDALLSWCRAPVEFEGRTIERVKGLPQGAVVAPILANLYLDQFDEAIDAMGLKLVRFADDFVVMGRNESDLDLAKRTVTTELRKLGLALNEDKTDETTFDEGFRFLGSVFCRSMVLDVEKPGKASAILEKMPEDVVHAGTPIKLSGWLSDFTKGKAGKPEHEIADRRMLHRWRAPIAPPSIERKPIYVISRGVKLIGRKRGLYVEREDDSPMMIGWSEISELVLLGGKYISSSVMQRALRHRVPIALHKWDGTPLGLVLPDKVRSPSPVTLLQWKWSEDSDAGLDVSRKLIAAKIRNTRMLVRRRKEDGIERLLEQLKAMATQAEKARDPDSLRGVEGRAAHAYFSQWPTWLKGDLPGFPGRTTRGAEDPVNVMLNFLYTQLFRLTHTTIFSVGLDPYLGVLHEGKGRYAALAADLMEPFRFVVDRVVLNAVNHGEVKDKDFIRKEKGPYKLMLASSALKLLLARFEELMSREVSDTAEKNDTFRGHLYRQTMSLRRFIDGSEDIFTAFRMKW